jgi:hypothetical protein
MTDPQIFVPIILVVMIVWSLIWKGMALWKSARNGQKKWFIVCLILNTLGILEIAYLFYFSKPKATK